MTKYKYTKKWYVKEDDKFVLENVECEIVDRQFYENCVCKEAIGFFRSLGGKEIVTSKNGLKQIKSISPSGEQMSIHLFEIANG